jgi:hypothetical protein
MLRSKPNARNEPIIGRRLNKLAIENKSTYEVKYEARIYEARQITHVENGGNINVAGLGAGANNVTDYSHAAPLDTETGIIPKNDCNYVTVDGSKKVRIRYYYVGLHNGYTEEQRNFTVYDEVWFEQPSPETIKQIKQEQTNEEEHLKQEQANTKHMPCATVFKNKCNTNGITTECPHCGHFFCSWHIKVNNGLLPGGHVCY